MTRYRKIAEDLIGHIRSGGIKVGSVLPGELQFMRDYAASRHTIRDALRQLEEEGSRRSSDSICRRFPNRDDS